MTTTPPTTTANTLPATWTPTAPGCLRSTDYWIWMYNTDLASSDARTVLGGPSQTTDCLAPTWTSNEPYVGTQCPPNYTPACSAESVTCCPTVYDFSCANVQPTAHQEMFRCVSKWDRKDETAVITLTNFQENKIGQVTRDLRSDQHLMAMAMVYTTPTTTAASETSTSDLTSITTASPPPPTPTSSSTPPSNAPLSAGTAAGIGVGAAAGVLLTGLLCAWLFWRRRKAAKKSKAGTELGTSSSPPPAAQTSSSHDGTSPLTAARYYQTPTTPSELPTERDPGELLGTTPLPSNRYNHNYGVGELSDGTSSSGKWKRDVH